MFCSSLPWTSLQAVVVAGFFSRPFPTRARRSEFTAWRACSSGPIISTASSIAPERLHISLFFLGGLPERQLSARHGRLPRMCGPSRSKFRSTAPRVSGAGRAIVLCTDRRQGLRRLQSFRRMLGAALTRRGLSRVANTNFTPHVTLLYDARSVDEYPIGPIFWTVTEFVLIHSMKGHDYLARWPL